MASVKPPAPDVADGRVNHRDARFDPITTEVVRRALLSVAGQMRTALLRAAFSVVLHEGLDFCCVLYDTKIRLLAQSPKSMPTWVGKMDFCIELTVDAVGGPGALEDGDILFSTYGYHIGSHPQDAAVIMPIFSEGRLVGYSAAKAHQADLGGKYIYGADTTDNFQEGVIFPGVKLYRRGKRDDDLFRTILANSRMPAYVNGDVHAAITAVHTGRRGLLRVIERYGYERFTTITEHMFDHGEAVMRHALSALADGRYPVRGAIDSNGVDDELIPFELAIEVAGSNVVVDFTNSPPEQRGPINNPLPNTVSAARFVVLCLAGLREHANEGHFRPIKVKTREGTLFHPRPPAPLFIYNWSARVASDSMYRALAEAMPEAIPAGGGGCLSVFVWWGHDDKGNTWDGGADHFAGQGASSRADGGTPLMHMANDGYRNVPVEIMESTSPILVEEFSLAPDSGGAGRFRGGLGVDATYRLLSAMTVTVIQERQKTPPWGLFGGEPARPNSWIIEDPDGRTRPGPGKLTAATLEKGTRMHVRGGGGGGYGPRDERPPAHVQADLRDGYLTEATARRDYPHAFADGTEKLTRESQSLPTLPGAAKAEEALQ